MAAYGIGNKVNGLITLPSTGIGSAVSIIVGQNVGAKQWSRARQGYRLSMIICVVFLFTGGMILSRAPVSQAIVGIFSDDSNVIAMAADFLSVMAFWCFANGIYDATSGFFRGCGKTMINMIIDISRLWIFRFGTLYICQNFLNMGVRSVWYSVVVSNGLAAAILLLVYIVTRKQAEL
jgi:Na+-driven multidrug efflux pump